MSSRQDDALAIGDLYPGAKTVVAALEFSTPEHVWSYCRKLGLEKSLAKFKHKGDISVRAVGETEEYLASARIARTEMDHPDFIKYLMAKLGMM
jgi:hypothetical protein